LCKFHKIYSNYCLFGFNAFGFPQLLAAVNSVYGSTLRVDSTKKACKKLQGYGVGTATWMTNVGNEGGKVLVSILPDLKGLSSLQRMAQGLMGRYVCCLLNCGYAIRYRDTSKPDPILLYTDMDCCSLSGPSKLELKQIFK